MRYIKLFEHYVDKYGMLSHEIKSMDVDDLTLDIVANYVELKGIDINRDETEEEVVERVWEHIQSIQKSPNPMVLYRVLYVPEGSELNRNNVGKHYVINPTRIDDIFLFDIGIEMDDDDNLFIVKVEANKSDIDLLPMMMTNVEYSHESEVTLKENSKVNILSVEKYFDV